MEQKQTLTREKKPMETIVANQKPDTQNQDSFEYQTF